MATAYHAKYFAHELTRRSSKGDIDRLSLSLFNATVDLNPHQIEAALFALQSPISKGVILADEVGLGKTIEAGLVLCQYWAEQRRILLIICPASLRKQWALELHEKFNIPSIVLDSKEYSNQKKNGIYNPFEQNRTVIISFQFASKMRDEIRLTPCDLVVIDEAHKLRNVYQPSNKMGKSILWGIEDKRKILLTATPLQNSLLEIYGLSTLIDEHIFGDVQSFRAQYANKGGELSELRERLESFCTRTLRKNVIEYIPYTERNAITFKFKPSENEQNLYDAISKFLVRENTFSIPDQQRHLITLILRKLLASSPFAVAGTLQTMRQRLIKIKDGIKEELDLAQYIFEHEDIDPEIMDEALSSNGDVEQINILEEIKPKIDPNQLLNEIEELDRYITWAHSINVDSKIKTLLEALQRGFSEMSQRKAQHKALIFTESRRTQTYIKEFLESNGYLGKIVTFNGTNADSESKNIYDEWVKKNQDNGRSSGSKAIDMRTAIIEHFRDYAEIMIATEAGAEGVNLQFCSLVINYDLPWNPQRIEQRIGRCHRYGQKYDVVVINFLNERNQVDLRVYELLKLKFNLFSGLFGASDEVLGTIESGIDFEKRVNDIYEKCRTEEAIKLAFDTLQAEMEDAIQNRIADTRKILLEHFDEDVHFRLKTRLDDTNIHIDHVGKMFWQLSKHILCDHAVFNDNELAFHLATPPVPSIHTGTYRMISKQHENTAGEFLYRLSHPLGEFVLRQGKVCPTPVIALQFDYSNHPAKLSVVETLKGKKGWLHLQRLEINMFDKEEYLLFSGFDDDGNNLNQETCEKLFQCTASTGAELNIPDEINQRLKKEAELHREAAKHRSLEENNKHFRDECDKLDKWAEDKIKSTEKELVDAKAKKNALKRESRLAETIVDQRNAQIKILEQEKVIRNLRKNIWDQEDEINHKRDILIEHLERRMSQQTSIEPLFTIRWSVV